MEALVQTQNLTKQYGQHKAVSNVNLSVKKGEIYGLIGRNGAGKTTVLRLISKLAKPTKGDIFLFGQNSHDTNYSQNRVGILIENPGVYPNMSAKDNLISFKILNILYALVEQFTHFNITQYMLDANIFQIGMMSTKPIYTRAAFVGLIFLLAEIVLLCVVIRKKDIK